MKECLIELLLKIIKGIGVCLLLLSPMIALYLVQIPFYLLTGEPTPYYMA